MKILVTGENGFIAKNVIAYFEMEGHEILSISHKDTLSKLELYCKQCDFVMHLAAVQRSNKPDEFWEGNVNYTLRLIEALIKANKRVPILYSSSIAIDNDSLFSITKKKGEAIIREYSCKYTTPTYIFKLNHIFGRYGKPNFNNVIATFCFNASHHIPLVISDPAIQLDVTYIEDLLLDFDRCVRGKEHNEYYLKPSIIYKRSLGEVVKVLAEIKNGVRMMDDFSLKLKQTYEFYLEEEKC